VLSDDESNLFEFTTAAAAKDMSLIAAVQATKASFWALVPPNIEVHNGPASVYAHPIYCDDADGNVDLARMTRRIHAMQPGCLADNLTPPNSRDPSADTQSGQGPADSLAVSITDDAEREQCSSDQQAVYDHIVGNIEGRGNLKPWLCCMAAVGRESRLLSVGSRRRSALTVSRQSIPVLPGWGLHIYLVVEHFTRPSRSFRKMTSDPTISNC
jgi:hypothetical protein